MDNASELAVKPKPDLQPSQVAEAPPATIPAQSESEPSRVKNDDFPASAEPDTESGGQPQETTDNQPLGEPSPVFPEAQQPPVFPEPPPPKKKTGRPALPRDEKGRIIRDPAKPANMHNVRDDKGHFIPRPPPKADFSDILGQGEPQAAQPAFNGELVDYTKLAEITFSLSTGMLSGVFGPEWQPENEEERKFVVQPLAAYYRSKEVKDLPPGVLLAVVVSAYGIRRLPKPGTSTKLKLWWVWLTSKFKRKKPILTPLS
jgi:hypothetical protein